MYLCDAIWPRFQTLRKTTIVVWRACVTQACCIYQGELVNVYASMLRMFGEVTNVGWE
jgi:hypothetical protein